jgi:serine/threonine-protein kinase
MVVRGGFAKITDFGIARMPTSAVKTMTGLILGSPRYMSPEQVIGKELDHRTDIFSLGVVLHEALTGIPPFDGDNVNAIMYATVNTHPPSPSATNVKLPAMLDLVIAKALAKNVDERYQTMEEFASDLNKVKRLFLARQPDGKFVATQSLSPSKAVSLETLGIGRYQKKDEAPDQTKPLKIDKSFDSFDATLKLAAMTNQTAEFGKYISDTRQMRAYQGAVTGSLAAATDRADKTQSTTNSPPASPWSNDIPYISPALSRSNRISSDTATMKLPHGRPHPSQTTVVHVAVVVTLAIAAVVLGTYVLAR